MTIRSSSSTGISQSAPAPTPFALVGGAASILVLCALFYAATWVFTNVPWVPGAILRASGFTDTVLNEAVLIVGSLLILAALIAFEFASRLTSLHPLRKAWVYWDTTRRTTYDSLIKPVFWVFALTAGAWAILAVIFAPSSFSAAFDAVSLAPLATGEAVRVLGCAVAIAAGFVALRNLSKFLFEGRAYLVGTLAKHVPADAALLARTPVSQLQFYHGVLRLSGAVAFVCELAFQTLAFGLATCGIATALQEVPIFTNQETLSLASAVLYWGDRIFALFDGQTIFGLTMSALEPNKAIWPFGLAILFFKLFVIGMIIRLFQDSLHLRPRDISQSWGDALEDHQRAARVIGERGTPHDL